MCEACKAASLQNTITKRAGMDALFAQPIDGRGALVDGFEHFLWLARSMEMTCRVQTPGQDTFDPLLVEEFKAALRSLTPAQRTAVIRLARWTGELVKGLADNVAFAKMEAKDTDMTAITATVEGREIVVRVNGQETNRVPLDPEQDPQEALDSAERAMAAHREHYGGL